MSFEWVVLRNTAAGPSAVPEARVQEALERHGVVATIESPTGIDEMRRAACEAVERGRPIALVGGDGTVSTVVDALAHQGIVDDAVVGVLPAGTGCDLIRTFGIPQSIEEAARHLSTTHTYRIDVGRLEGAWGIRHFVNVANTGLAAAVVEAAAKLPRRLGGARYLTAVVAAAPGFQACEVELSTPRHPAHRRSQDGDPANASAADARHASHPSGCQTQEHRGVHVHAGTSMARGGRRRSDRPWSLPGHDAADGAGVEDLTGPLALGPRLLAFGLWRHVMGREYPRE